jgi:hypothetical protein
MITAGLVAAAGMLFLLFKFGVRKVITYDIFFDVVITVLLMLALAGIQRHDGCIIRRINRVHCTVHYETYDATSKT